jgi:hypothetical protein
VPSAVSSWQELQYVLATCPTTGDGAYPLSPNLHLVYFKWLYFLPESLRWLISKGQGAEAMAILMKYHVEGDINSQFVCYKSPI